MMAPDHHLHHGHHMTRAAARRSLMILLRIGRALLTLVALLSISVAARANCSFNNGSSSSSVNFTIASPISIPPAPTSGTTLATTGPSAPSSPPTLTCTSHVPYGIVNLIGSNTPTGGNNYIYPTNVPGVGYQLYHEAGTSTSAGYMFPYPDGDSGAAATSSFSVTTALQLVQTGPIANGSQLAGGTRLANWQWGSVVPEYFVLSNTVTFVASACQVTINPIAVVLPTVSTQTFSGAGSTAGTTAFDIQLNCPSGSAALSINFSGTRDSRRYSNVLRNTGNARNVGVQMLDQSSNPITFNNNSPNNETSNLITLGSTHAGAMTLPFAARYYATSGSVTAGSVVATATFNLIYD